MATDKHWTNRVLTDAEAREIFGDAIDGRYRDLEEKKEKEEGKERWWAAFNSNKNGNSRRTSGSDPIKRLYEDDEPNKGAPRKIGMADMNEPEPEHPV